jgi:alanine racemase
VPGIRRRALIDLEAFRSNASGGDLDARADAYGHGIRHLAEVALSTGHHTVVVSDDRDSAAALAAGYPSAAVRIDRAGAEASTTAYGVDGVGRPVMSLIGEVIAVKEVGAGEGVSYGYTYRTRRATRLALVGLGYADGVPRLASNRARVLVGDARHPLVGRIAMDQFMLDVGDAEVEAGMDAVLFGDPDRGEPSAREWAEWTERSPLALTAGIAARVVREIR